MSDSSSTLRGPPAAVTDCVEVAHFDSTHLAMLPEGKARRILRENKHYTEALISEDAIEKRTSIASFLDSISHDIHRLLPSRRPKEIALNFRTYNMLLRHHPRSTEPQDRPHIIGSYCPDMLQLPWHRVETVVQIIDSRSNFDKHLEQIRNLLGARPDCPGIYFLTFTFNTLAKRRRANIPEYCIGWADAAGVVKSPWYRLEEFTDPLPLVSYIYSLYRPPRDHLLKDISITWTEEIPLGPPRWNVKCKGRTYKGCTIMYAAGPSERRTIIFEYRQGKNLYMIKDVYWDATRRQEEGPVLKAIHSKGIVPGVVQIKDHETVIGSNRKRIFTPSAVDLNAERRIRLRIVLASKGVRLTRAKSVKDLLMAIYDANEAHRIIVLKSDVLHRDMSANNILIYPEHDDPTGKNFMQDPPKFISAVLKDGSMDSRSLIIDVDNAASMRDKESRFYAEMDRDDSTGTPSYIARAVASCGVLNTRQFAAMPELFGKAKELYVDAYSQESYDAYTDGEETWHGVPRKLKEQANDYRHEPRHDVESCFWSLVDTALLVCPMEKNKDRERCPTHRAQFTWNRLRGHRMTPVESKDEEPLDSRDVLLIYTENDWKEALHPGLAPLAALFTHLAKQIRPEYALLKEAPRQDHLHEALRRLLLQYIVDMEDPIALNIKRWRPLRLDANTVHVRNEDTSAWPAHLKSEPQPPVPKVVLRLPKRPQYEEEGILDYNDFSCDRPQQPHRKRHRLCKQTC